MQNRIREAFLKTIPHTFFKWGEVGWAAMMPCGITLNKKLFRVAPVVAIAAESQVQINQNQAILSLFSILPLSIFTGRT
jgi:hypothetical protein